MDSLNGVVKTAVTFKYGDISPYQRLPPQLVIPSAGTHLYSHGIVLFPPLKGAKRPFYYHPLFIYTMELIYFTRSLVSLLIPEMNREYFIYSGDYMYFIRAKTHINIAATQYMLVGMSILTLNSIRYYYNQKPEFIECYDFLAGKCTPIRAGLRNEKYINGLVVRSKAIFKVTQFNTRLVFVVSFIMSIFPLVVNSTSSQIFIFALPWSLVFAVSSFYTFSSFFWNIAYFYILCHLMKYRLRETCDRAVRAVQFPRQFRQTSQFVMQKQIMVVSEKVRLYNSTYWASILFLIVFFMSTFNNVVLYAALFVPMNLIVQISLFYANGLSILAIFFLLNTASVVYHESNRARDGLSSMYVSLHQSLAYRSLYKVS